MGKCDDLRNDTNAMNALSRLFATFRAPSSHERATHRTRRRHSRRPSSLIAGEALEPKQLMAVDVVNAFADQSLSTSAPVTIAITNQFDLTDVIGTVAKFETNAPLGGTADLTSNDFYVELYDKSGAAGTITSGTVSNFLSYVNDGSYDNSMIHRSVSDFVIQGGGFTAPSVAADQPGSDPVAIATKGTITNEPGNSNLRGTLAMAKLGGQPNSATSQWFVNQSDNTFLDTDNGGYAVFGEVLGDGMTVVDVMGSALTYDATTYYSNSAFSDLPLWNVNADNIVLPQDFVKIETITALTDESELMTYSVTTSDSSKLAASINAQGDLVLTPVAGQTGSVSVTVTATSKTDGSTASDTFAVGLGGEDPATIIESFGSVSLSITNGILTANSSPLKNGATSVAVADFPFMQFKAAETVGGVNRILMFDTRISAHKTWATDSNWKITAVDPLPVAGSAEVRAMELAFDLDLDGDGTKGTPSVVIESYGDISLVSQDGALFAGTTAIINGAQQVTTTDFSFMEFIGVETVGGVNKVLMFDTRVSAYKTWATDTNWKITAVERLPAKGTDEVRSLELAFDLDLDNDTYKGTPPGIVLESHGIVSLVNSAGILLAGTTPILNGSTPVALEDFSFMQFKGAETVDGVNRVLMYDTRTSSYKTWATDLNWKITEVAQLPEAGSTELRSLETAFDTDLDGDHFRGTPNGVVIDGFGEIPLLEVGGELFAGSNSLRVGSTVVKQLDFSFMQFKGVEVVDGVNTALMFDTRISSYKTWSLDASWTVTGVATLSASTEASLVTNLETSFDVDLNGDFFRGTPTGTLLDSHGSVPLIESNGSIFAGSHVVRVGTTQVTTADFSFMEFKGAETVNGTNRILMYDTRIASYKTWTLNSSWTVTSVEALPSDSATLQLLESSFDIDIDGDFFRGTPTGVVLDSFGDVPLIETGDALFAGAKAIRVGSTQVTTTDFSFMQFKGVETVSGINRMLMYDTRVSSYKTWVLDVNWTVTAVEQLPMSDTTAIRGLETAFDIDLDGDLFKGTPVGTPIESNGAVFLMNAAGALLAGTTPIKAGTTHVTVSGFSFMQFQAAETIGGVNRVLMYDTRISALKTWALDSDWTITAVERLPASGTPELNALELGFNLDLDNDQSIGPV